MSAPGISLRHLTFLGSNRKPATIAFGLGLNVVYGASDTGKSFIVDAIDFMLGGRGPLRDISQRVGYDRILLAFEISGGEQFTLLRSVDGGHFRLFEGLFSEVAPVGEGKELSDQHSDRNDENLSAFLLAKIDLGKKRIRKNKQNDTLSLSFRNLARLVIINEEEIIQRRSPLADGTYTNDTPNMAVFKLLLTGVDDSALVSSKASTPEEHSREGQIELLDQLITEAKQQIRDLAGPPAQLEEQLGRLDETMAEQGRLLAHSEAEYREIAGRRRDLLKRLEEGNNRLTEISSLLERFALLDEHYKSDIARLKGIEEAGTLSWGVQGISRWTQDEYRNRSNVPVRSQQRLPARANES